MPSGTFVKLTRSEQRNKEKKNCNKILLRFKIRVPNSMCLYIYYIDF